MPRCLVGACFLKELSQSVTSFLIRVFLKGAYVLNANFSPIERFKLMSIVDAIPREWRQIIRESTQHSLPSHIGDNVYLKLENSEVTLSKISSKLLYNAFKSKKQIPPTAQIKFQEKFPQLQADWKEIYSFPFTVSIESKIREFQYKILNNIVFTNEKLFRLKMTDSPLCAFCNRETESVEHLFFYCDVTMTFWEVLCSWLDKYKIKLQPFTIMDILFGVFKMGDDFNILNHVILAAKLYIYKCKLKIVHPSLRVYKAKMKSIYQVEKTIASRRNKLRKHFKKWEKLLPYVSS